MARIIKDFNEYSEKTRIGAEYFNNKQYDNALQIFLELADYNEKNYKVYETLALIYIKLKNIDAADEAFKKALSLYSERSQVKIQLQSFEETVARLDNIEKLHAMYQDESTNYPEGAEIENPEKTIHRLPIMIGMQYMAKGEFKKAEEFLITHREKYFQVQ